MYSVYPRNPPAPLETKDTRSVPANYFQLPYFHFVRIKLNSPDVSPLFLCLNSVINNILILKYDFNYFLTKRHQYTCIFISSMSLWWRVYLVFILWGDIAQPGRKKICTKKECRTHKARLFIPRNFNLEFIPRNLYHRRHISNFFHRGHHEFHRFVYDLR